MKKTVLGLVAALAASVSQGSDWLYSGTTLIYVCDSKDTGMEVDTPLDYGDYYFLEALLRFRRFCE